ncbi:hypothetical protein DO021_21685 [Desulfobacter hydrogenophilus]|uniref:Uncharacterized protein n=1 Tax=Desulfobacter hydrogenophilus TaxID=2291 RepID=A0A328F5Z0_9BACT|nr:hypothetical protein [Desulfobacter hydrogenophilus]NDY74492.1 hypothetical protein [Desulfobacter hydrogenophilus]QBH15165.1 hypothetical protein EYB58_20910 [Desulfobacter hydrogenophilus]RAL99940.1 hypothetical protein DO021_21685 [Desulfobacter hydrogenophilus]
MKISWEIKKKRGNYRPVLTYTMTLESFEKSLAIHAVSVKSFIPRLPRPHENFCLPGENERHPHWIPKRFHIFQVPYFKAGETSGFIRLPYRESGKYPEVETSFRQLRDTYEEKVCEAYGQGPFENRGNLDISAETREHVAAKVTANRLLAIFN